MRPIKGFFAAEKRVAPSAALTNAMAVLEGQAQDCDPESLHLRVAEQGGQLWIDLGEETGRAIRISDDGWRIVSAGIPVVFHRTELTQAMPTPSGGGSLEPLWDLANIDAEDRPIVLAWLVAALLCPGIPHPILAVFGEQGSGKSTTSRLLVDLIDPSPSPLRKPASDTSTWITAAAGSYVVGLDNLSHVTPALSDSLCRAVTGEADIRRTLYTDARLSVFRFRRVILLNGIDVGALRGDLAERLVTLSLRPIDPRNRRAEDEIQRRLQESLPDVLGALLDLAAQIQKRLPQVNLAEHPRMADFARVLAAVDQIHGTDGMGRYGEMAQAMAEDSLQSDLFVAALFDRIRAPFEGSSADLLKRVAEHDEANSKDWPKDGRAVTALLRGHAPALRASGWTVQDDKAKNKAKVLRWTIDPPRAEE